MAREFHPDVGPWTKWAPSGLQAAFSMPNPVATATRGRIELVIGRLGAGKTTWGALRATRLARATDRQVATNGVGWEEPWHCVSSFDEMEELRDVVFVWDELHLMLPSSKGLLGRDHERFLIRWLSLCRKRGICVVGTTQAWTRCATHYRQLVTTVWVASPVKAGKLHCARAFDPPEDGGRQSMGNQWFGPAAARIPTHATVWHGYNDGDGPTGAPAPAANANVIALAKRHGLNITTESTNGPASNSTPELADPFATEHDVS